ncbi:uncharacterized protein zgc:174863 isoform X2 [Betta splendens]|uniref:Uncharacterized protein zgc:174863 isoform X2 n=1 Tax=Betta splendens TaxID=158456 RepID=A0A6P7N8I4_BETSP|nr:uncharacterized protein zgc:174863 isoform X2 [Betta splendens]
MASIFTLFSAAVAVSVGFGDAQNEFVWVECKSNTGRFGHQSMLDCVIKTSEEVVDPKILTVTWRKAGDEDPLLVFNRGKLSSTKGYSFAQRSWNDKNMNISLLIANTEIQHEGEYTCRVFTDSGVGQKETKLSVTAAYKEPIITSNPMRFQQGQNLILTCATEGGFPQGELRWYVDKKTDWTKSATFQATPGPDGRFKLSSTLELLQGSTFSTYTCVVFNASNGKEEEVTFDINKSLPIHGPEPTEPLFNHSKWVAPVVVIGSLIVGLLLLLFFRRRCQSEHETVPNAPPYDDDEAPDVEKGNYA